VAAATAIELMTVSEDGKNAVEFSQPLLWPLTTGNKKKFNNDYAMY